MTNTATLFLPWPDKRLSPNARVHWSALARAKKSAKNVAFYTAKEAGLGKIEAERLSVKYSFFPPSDRNRDADNLIASMKAAQDGLSQAIGIDDSKWDITVDHRGAVQKNGMVKVELEWQA